MKAKGKSKQRSILSKRSRLSSSLFTSSASDSSSLSIGRFKKKRRNSKRPRDEFKRKKKPKMEKRRKKRKKEKKRANRKREKSREYGKKAYKPKKPGKDKRRPKRSSEKRKRKRDFKGIVSNLEVNLSVEREQRKKRRRAEQAKQKRNEATSRAGPESNKEPTEAEAQREPEQSKKTQKEEEPVNEKQITEAAQIETEEQTKGGAGPEESKADEGPNRDTGQNQDILPQDKAETAVCEMPEQAPVEKIRQIPETPKAETPSVPEEAEIAQNKSSIPEAEKIQNKSGIPEVETQKSIEKKEPVKCPPKNTQNESTEQPEAELEEVKEDDFIQHQLQKYWSDRIKLQIQDQIDLMVRESIREALRSKKLMLLYPITFRNMLQKEKNRKKRNKPIYSVDPTFDLWGARPHPLSCKRLHVDLLRRSESQIKGGFAHFRVEDLTVRVSSVLDLMRRFVFSKLELQQYFSDEEHGFRSYAHLVEVYQLLEKRYSLFNGRSHQCAFSSRDFADQMKSANLSKRISTESLAI